MPTALLIDLDDTLIDDRGAMAAAVLRFRSKHALLPDQQDSVVTARWDDVGRALWRRMVLGEVTFTEQRRARLREVFSMTLSDQEADALFADYLTFYEQSWVLLPGADEFLAATAHLPRAIVTNGYRPQAHKKLDRLGLAAHFTAVITPDDCGARKPDPKIFLHALQLLGVQPAQAMMIGDNMEADILPALALGMGVFHVNALEVGRSIRDATRVAAQQHPSK
jgi:HAD superfamily hydrolase (TIGR01549 family)